MMRKVVIGYKGLLEERRLEKPDMAKMKALWAKIVDSWGPQGGPQEKRGDIGPADAGKLHATYRSNYGYKTGEWAKAVIAIDEVEKQSHGYNESTTSTACNSTILSTRYTMSVTAGISMQNTISMPTTSSGAMSASTMAAAKALIKSAIHTEYTDCDAVGHDDITLCVHLSSLRCTCVVLFQLYLIC